MTTLAFGDMYAYAGSLWGHVLLTVQVLLGYVLLAALVTRFAILFQAGGPAGKFAKREKKRKTGQDQRDEQRWRQRRITAEGAESAEGEKEGAQDQQDQRDGGTRKDADERG